MITDHEKEMEVIDEAYWADQRERYKNVIGMAESVCAGHCTHTGTLKFSYAQLEELCLILAARTASTVGRN